MDGASNFAGTRAGTIHGEAMRGDMLELPTSVVTG